MRISLNWLNEYIDIKRIPAADIAKALTDSGLEVESTEDVSVLKGDVVVGEIVQAEKHPDADSLRVCKVNIGTGEPLDIVCGAPNARVGIKACVALVGSTLPGDFKIKKSKIRGVPSNGMMCAEDELGISKNHDTIIEVASDVAIGTSVAELYGLKDTVLTLGITPNRGDCLGYIGVARDLGAKLGIPLKVPQPARELTPAGDLKTEDRVQVEILDQDACPRLCALYVEGLSIGPSPSWMQRRLESANMRPINNIVDVTNYVMLEFGQPIHAYDARDLRGGKIIVTRAKAGEKFKTLDSQERILSSDDIMICDQEGPIGLAGVMGGENSEVKSDTTAIVIEVASFDARAIRKTAKRLGMHTEASHRFERGTDTAACDIVAWRTAQLLEQVAKAQNQTIRCASTLVDVYHGRKEAEKIAVRTSRARQILGLVALEPTRIIDALQGLGLTLLDQTPDKERLLFQIPPWRRDLHREIDLIEEVGRMVGYDRVPYLLPQMEIGGTPENPFILFVDTCKKSASYAGMNEIISFPFVSAEDMQKFRLESTHLLAQAVELRNAIAEHQNKLRTSLLLTMIPTVVENRRRGDKGTRLFECARVYFKNGVQSATSSEEPVYLKNMRAHGAHISDRAKADERVVERNQLAGVLDQPFSGKSWLNPQIVYANFFHGRAVVERLLNQFGLRNADFVADGIGNSLPFLHPGASAWVKVGNRVLGYVGELHPETAKAFDFDVEHTPVVFELSLDELYEASRITQKIDAEERKFPPLTLDLAFVIDRGLSFHRMKEAIRRFPNKRNLRSFELFDVYQGENVAADKKSMALSFTFQSPKRTLSDKEVEIEVEALKNWLKQELQAELR